MIAPTRRQQKMDKDFTLFVDMEISSLLLVVMRTMILFSVIQFEKIAKNLAVS